MDSFVKHGSALRQPDDDWMPVQPLQPGVIWISGYSAAGKTTVGRRVHRMLVGQNVPAVFLDGDDLRAIFAGRWGYDRGERVELARVYFRLCSHLAAQGTTVIICAVAMYDEVREWFHANIPRGVEVYLDVPEDERRRRDALTKRIYDTVGSLGDLYDEPTSPSLALKNFGSATPEAVAAEIVRFYRSAASRQVGDAGRTEHWKAYYQEHSAPLEPSSFARHVADREPCRARLLEVGCGNGRDASFFADRGFAVTAVDTSETAIDLCHRTHKGLRISFLCGSLSVCARQVGKGFDIVYSRFCLHAMSEAEEVATLAAAAKVLNDGGRLFIECRSINDPLARKGEVISPTERIYGHYRRFIVLEDLKARVEAAGFLICEATESDGLAVYGDDNPVVIRLMAQRRGRLE